MIIREAKISDIKALHVIRLSVKENILSNPLKITEDDYNIYLTKLGKGWLCEVNNEIAGFAIIDEKNANIWALFVSPDYQGKGIGKKLQETMLSWYFNSHTRKLWLSTALGTVAENFYRKTGWQEVERIPKGEIKFELTLEQWKKNIC